MAEAVPGVLGVASPARIAVLLGYPSLRLLISPRMNLEGEAKGTGDYFGLLATIM